ncbi:MAG: sterol carrier protein domain-containing protein, partial [Asgard group archaeon]|nr:sterol carrier protein domain-containing protein [Asgard group archaeon]
GRGYDWAPKGELSIFEFHATTANARRTLFYYLYLHADQIETVHLPINCATSEIFPWLQGYANPNFSTKTLVMARIIDVESVLKSLPLQSDSKIILKVSNEQCSWNNKCFRIHVKKNNLEISETTPKKNSIEITIQGLTSLLYGTLSANDLEAFTWLKNASPKDKQQLDDWFPLKKPFFTEGF